MNAQETAEDFLNKHRISFDHFGEIENIQIDLLAHLLLTTWNQGAKTGARISGACFDQVGDEWRLPWTGPAFDVRLESLPTEDKNKK